MSGRTTSNQGNQSETSLPQTIGIFKEEPPDINAIDGVRLNAYNTILTHLKTKGYEGLKTKKLIDPKTKRGLTIDGHALRQTRVGSVRVHVCSSPIGFYIIQGYAKAESDKQNRRRIANSMRLMKAFFNENFPPRKG